MDESIEITRAKLIAALAQWEAEGSEQGWTKRDDESRHADTADYLLNLMSAN